MCFLNSKRLGNTELNGNIAESINSFLFKVDGPELKSRQG